MIGFTAEGATICLECKHCEKGTQPICSASRTRPTYNYVTGMWRPTIAQFCEDINTQGRCSKYERLGA